MTDTTLEARIPPAKKFRDPEWTAKGERRGRVALARLETVWFNTGTLCNLACRNCYIDSSPTNDRLAYITAAEVAFYLDEIAREKFPVREIGFTGGEPFMNPEILEMVGDTLARGFEVLILTNAMTPMRHRREGLMALRARHGDRLRLRVSLDHYTKERHEKLRGPRSWQPALDSLLWLAANGFAVSVAGRTCWDETLPELRAGYGRLFRELGVTIDPANGEALVLFPEMDATADVPEITDACWSLLGVRPETIMCATSRMVIKRKGATRPVVVSCTLLPDDPQFELGPTLRDAHRTVRLNHPHCARFCVLGGASCS